MTTSHDVSEFDLFYLSYDEPKCEETWARLVNLAPWAQRVHGVKGFDNAHKECARRSETSRFFTLDGDCEVFPKFFELKLDIPEKLKDSTLSFSSRNIINGLAYGNGGIKLWTKDFVLGMRTHENAASEAEKLDFCWDGRYAHMPNVYSDTCPNGSPYQAFRAGFREGVKMSRDRGNKTTGLFKNQISRFNYARLMVWASVGADVENGRWAMFGTRLGIFKSILQEDWDPAHISDYEWFKNFFDNEVAPNYLNCEFTAAVLDDASARLGRRLNQALGLHICDLNAEQSRFVKMINETNELRTRNPLTPEFDLFSTVLNWD